LDVDVRDRLATAPDHLFAYGTLQFPEVLEALLGRIPVSTPASVPGWRAAALERRVYPGLVPANGTATGLLLTGLTRKEWRTLDDFEDDHYDLRRLRLADGQHGWAYVWPVAEVLAENWSAADFAARHLAVYTARCAGLAAHRDSPAC
jgi:gamma-glutamylcyclotransferase (GGCT)/AIG2-like uncharacterized protein YtfP